MVEHDMFREKVYLPEREYAKMCWRVPRGQIVLELRTRLELVLTP